MVSIQEDGPIAWQRVQAALETAGVGVLEFDTSRNIIVCNDRCRELLGFADGEPPACDEVFRYAHSGDMPQIEDAVNDAQNSADGRLEMRFRVRNPQGSGYRWLLFQGIAMQHDPDTLCRISGIVQEINATEIVRAGATAGGAMAEAAMANTVVGIFHIILASNYIEYSPAFARILTGESSANLTRSDLICHIHPDDAPSRTAAYETASQNGDLYYEARTVWHDGSIHWVRTVGSFAFDPLGKPLLFTGTVQDITAERKAQDETAAARRLADLAIKSSGIGVFRFDLKNELTEYSPTFAGIFTGDEGKLNLSRKDFIARVWPEDEPLRAATMKEAMLSGEFHYEPRVVWDDGSVHKIRITGACIFDKSGRPEAFSGTAKDITEQEQQAKALQVAEEQFSLARRESEAMFRNVTNSSPTGLWLSDEAGRLTYLNKTLVDWTGMPYESLLSEGWTEAIIVEDRQRSEDAFLGAVATRGHYDTMFRIRKGDGNIMWCRAAGDPYFREDGSYAGYAGYCVDIDELVTVTNELKAGEDRFRSIVEQAPMAIGLLRGRDMIIEVGNDRIFEIWGKSSSIAGMRIIDALPEIEGQGFIELLENVYDTGVPFHGNGILARLERNGRMEEVYLDFSYTPLRDGLGNISGVMALAIEVTDQVIARRAVEESEVRFRSLIEEAPVATCLFVGRELHVEVANNTMISYWGKDRSIIGKPLREAVPELIGQPFLGILDDVFTTGITYEQTAAFAQLEVDGILGDYYFDFTYKPLRNTVGEIYGILEMAIDVTGKVLARQKLEESELFALNIFNSSPVAKLVLAGHDMTIKAINQNMMEKIGKDTSIIGKAFCTAIPEFASASMLDRLRHVLASGKTYYQPEERLESVKDGQAYTGYYNYIYKALRNITGEIYGIIITATEVTGQVLARQKVEEAELALRGAIELAELGTWTFDVAASQFSFSERLNDWFGFKGDETMYSTGYNPIHEADRAYIREAITGALNPDTGGFYDVEYRVVEYRNGRERICHAQGKTIFDDDGNPVKLMGTTQDVTEQRHIQLALEQQVKERTEQLTVINEQLARSNEQLVHSNEELAQYAYVASHDLQEPLRKIRMFSGMLESAKDLSGFHRQLVDKIAQSSERMSMLIRDLLEFSRLLKSDSLVRPVDLAEVTAAVVNDFELTIEEKRAAVHIGDLPVVHAVGLQMNQLFYNLLANALKFNKPDTAPHIAITAHAISNEEVAKYIQQPLPFAQYYQINIKDNGIGFEVKYTEQIFEVFKRLHGREVYPGSGIGLALCRRIVDNHNGSLFASSTPGEGSIFHLILPDKQQDHTAFVRNQLTWSDE